jgi:MFS transporter, DHA2 family, multidrug resistance protein
LVDILISPAHSLEYIYTEAILGYDALNLVSLNWIVLLGMLLGTIFTYWVFALRKWTYKTMTVIGFALLVGYLLMMYFTIDYNLPKEMLFFPLLMRGAGYIIVAITFITALSTVPFQNFFQALSIQAFISACCGSLLGAAILEHVFKFMLKKNAMLLSANLDNVNSFAAHISVESLYGKLQQHAMLVSMKEVYGWLCILGILCLLTFFLRESSLRPKSLLPKFSTIRHSVKHEIKMDKIMIED